MLTIIHGNDVVASRKFFQDERARISGAVLMQQAEVNLTSLAQNLEGGGLFEESKSLFIEEFLSERKKSAEKEAIISYLLAQSVKHEIILWEGKELTNSALTPFKSAKIKLFKLSSTLFALLDGLKPGSGGSLVSLFHKTIETTEAEMVFFMLVRQIRILLALSGDNKVNISEVARLAPWQKGKFVRQANLFDLSFLRQRYKRLFEIETAMKTGTLTTPLVSTVDFFLLEF